MYYIFTLIIVNIIKNFAWGSKISQNVCVYVWI